MVTAVAPTQFPPPIAGFEPLVPIEDAARILQRSHWTLRIDHKRGRIKCIRVGRRLMVEPAEIRRIIQQGL